MSVNSVGNQGLDCNLVNFFDNVPDEILYHIFSNLSLKDTSSLNLTNFRFSHFISNCTPLWEAFREKHFPNSCSSSSYENSKAFYQQCLNIKNNIKLGNYQLQTVDNGEIISCLRVNNKELISGSPNGTIKVWNLDTRQMVKQLSSPRTTSSRIFQIYNNKLMSGSLQGLIKILDLESGEQVRMLTGHRQHITGLQIHEDRLISSSFDGTIKIWNMENGKELDTVSHQSPVSSLLVYNDLLIAASSDRTIKIWDLKSENELKKTLLTDGMSIVSLLIYGNSLISGSADGIIKLWDTKNWQEIKSFGERVTPDWSHLIPCFQIYGDYLISSSLDGFIKIWDIQTGEKLQTIAGVQAKMPSLQVYEDSLISSSGKIIKILNFSSNTVKR